jgi:hypothetical protein
MSPEDGSALTLERTHPPSRWLRALGALAALAALGCAPRPAAVPRAAGLAVLDGGYHPLRERFEAERGHPRLLVLASPT